MGDDYVYENTIVQTIGCFDPGIHHSDQSPVSSRPCTFKPVITYSRDDLLALRSNNYPDSNHHFDFQWLKRHERRRARRGGSHIHRHIPIVTSRRSAEAPTMQRGIDFTNLSKVTKVNSVNKRSLPTLIVCNPCSLNNKIDEFQTLMNDNLVDIACISESWFKPDAPDDHLHIEDYCLFSKPRRDRLHGGLPCMFGTLSMQNSILTLTFLRA
jgi:hypothetical protein